MKQEVPRALAPSTVRCARHNNKPRRPRANPVWVVFSVMGHGAPSSTRSVRPTPSVLIHPGSSKPQNQPVGAEPHPSSSCDEPVLWMSPPRTSVRRIQRVGFVVSRPSFRRLRGRSLIEGSVRPVSVVLVHVLGEDGFEMPAAEDEEPVQALSADRGDKPLADGVRPGAQIGVLMIRIPWLAKTASKDELNLGSAISDREPWPALWSLRRSSKVRACG